MKKTKTQRNKGITLIALVITIIVLLILAGVTIAMLTGENGILNQAQNAKVETEKAGAEEKVDLVLSEWKVRKESGESKTFEDFLQEKKNDREIDGFSNNNNGTYTIKVDGNEIIVTEDGRGQTLLSALGENKTEHYGDTINYGIDLSNSDEGHLDGWKIFYANNEGTYIIAADYVRNDNPALADAMVSDKANMGKYNGYNYSAYWPSTSYLTKKDASGNALIDSNASKFMYNWTGGGMNQNNKIAVASLLDTNAWSSFLTDGATMAIGGPTVEMYRASWNAKTYASGTHTKLQLAPRDNGNGYYVGANNDDNTNPTTTYADMSSDVGYNDNLYYPHKIAYKNCRGYWLASPNACFGTSVMSVYCYGWVHNVSYNSEYSGVRPVVFLPSNIEASQDENGVWQIAK